MNIQTPIAVTVALLLVSGTLCAKTTRFRQIGPKKTTIVIVSLDLKKNTVTGSFLFGDRVGDKPDAEPAGRAVSFTGTVTTRSSDDRDVSMEINFAGKAPLDGKKNPLKWHLKKAVDGHQILTMPLSPQRLQAWLSSQGAL